MVGVNGYLWVRNYIIAQPRFPEGYKGFDIENTIVPKEDIRATRLPRDGIPALLHPAFEGVDTASNWLYDSDSVIGIVGAEGAKAYPVPVLLWHELVNDEIDERPILVSYCPLCGTAMVFERQVGEQSHTFGVSGLLYHSGVVMYDHQTESLWTQIGMECIAGPSVGARLEWLPSLQMTWARWREEYPDTLVLSRPPGFVGYERNYDRSPYEDYEVSPDTRFPVPRYRKDLPEKDWVLGVHIGGTAKAYPLDPMKDWTVKDTIGGVEVSVQWAGATRHAQVTGSDGKTFPSVQSFWFAWQAFYPETELYEG